MPKVFSIIRKEGFKKTITLIVGYFEIKAQIYMLSRFPNLAKFFSPKLSLIFLEPTNHCNLHCKMCYSGAREAGFMDYSLFTRLIDEIAAIGNIDLILHLGGESLTHPKFPAMLEYAMTKRSRLRRVGFFTNGTLLNAKIQEKLVKLGVDWVAISLEGLGKVNDDIRIGSNYKQIEANINGLLYKRGSTTRPEIWLALTDSGQSGIDDFIDSWINSVDYIRVCACFDSRLQITNPRFFNGHKTQNVEHCLTPCSAMVILWNGDVVACCANVNGYDVLGNVADEQVLGVWKGAKYRQLRHDLLIGKPKGLCSSCNTWKIRFRNHTERCENHQIVFYDIMKQYERRRN